MWYGAIWYERCGGRKLWMVLGHCCSVHARVRALGPLLLSWVKSASFVFNAYGWRRFMFMDGERVMVMDDGDGELCLGGSSG